jgi:hypothetical protein
MEATEVTDEPAGPLDDCVVAVDWVPENGEGSDDRVPFAVCSCGGAGPAAVTGAAMPAQSKPDQSVNPFSGPLQGAVSGAGTGKVKSAEKGGPSAVALYEKAESCGGSSPGLVCT